MQRIFVGDVQGCGEELAELLARARRAFGEAFELWGVGDLVNRGPDNRGALGRVRELAEQGRARCVLGNHEIALLRTWLGLRAPSPFDTFHDVLEAPDADAWCEWLRGWPVAETGTLGGQRFAIVHASVHPDWTLADLEAAARRLEARLRGPLPALRAFLSGKGGEGGDGSDGGEAGSDADALGRLTRCRSVARDGGWSSEPPGGRWRAWHEAWRARRHAYGVVYGHWSLQGLHVAPGLRGLDTGCVHHGRGRDGALTAWLPDVSARRPFDVPDRRFWSVAAHRAYYAHRDGTA